MVWKAIEVQYLQEGQSTPFATQIKDKDSGLLVGKKASARFALDLLENPLPNNAQVLTVRVTATDNRGQKSAVFESNLQMLADAKAPLASINTPVRGTTLYQGRTYQFGFNAKDNSQIQSVVVSAGSGNTLLNHIPEEKFSTSGTFNYTIPNTGQGLILLLSATDVHGNSEITEWRYDMEEDQPPEVTLRAPAPGSRLIEGEPFTLVAKVGDDKRVLSAEFFIRLNDDPDDTKRTRLFSKTFDDEQVKAAIDQAKFLTAGMRVPTKPEDVEIQIGVRAIDDGGNITEKLLELEILDDLEPPRITRLEPEQDFSLLPGSTFDVKGEANDNLFVDGIVPVLIDKDGVETELEWDVLSRDNRLESLTIPDPVTIGEVIVGERYYSDFSGKVALPTSFLERAGEVFKFVLRASDKGVNTTDTDPINITIEADTAKPVVTVQKPVRKTD